MEELTAGPIATVCRTGSIGAGARRAFWRAAVERTRGLDSSWEGERDRWFPEGALDCREAGDPRPVPPRISPPPACTCTRKCTHHRQTGNIRLASLLRAGLSQELAIARQALTFA